MGCRTRPRPVGRGGRQPGLYRTPRHVAERGQKMILVHRHGGEPGLEQMSPPSSACAEERRMAAVSFADGAREARLVARRQDEVNMVGRETAPTPAGHGVAPQLRAHQVQIQRLAWRRE